MRNIFFYFCALFALAVSVEQAEAGVYLVTTNYLVGNSPVGLALGNLRGNGLYRDLAVANYADDSVSVRLCLDDGTFGHMDTYPVGHNPSNIHFSDLNRDGMSDLITANSGTNTISVLINLGVGANFAPALNYVVGLTNPVPKDLTSADVNHDGRPDLIVANFNESSVSVLTNAGEGVLSGLTNYSVDTGPVSIIEADLNGDGLPDVVTANSVAGSISVLSGQTGGTFSAAVDTILDEDVDPQPVCVRAADFDGDGVLDLVTADYSSGRVSILIGQVDGGFWTVQIQDWFDVGTNPKSLCVRDFNHDGIPDIAVANESDDTVHVFLGNGDGTFEDQGAFGVGNAPAAIDGSNFNGDQSTDLVVANSADNDVTILLFSGPLAYGFKQNVIEDIVTNINLRGAVLSGNALSYFVVDSPTNGGLAGSGANLLYTPDSDYFGLDSFSFQVVDTNASLTSAVAMVTIQVLPVNDPPSFSLVTNQVTVLEDSTTAIIPDFTAGVSQGPDNETNQSISYVLTTTNSGFFYVKPSINASGTLSFRPKVNATGTATVSAVVRDTGGTLRGGIDHSPPQNFSVVVTPHPLKSHKGKFAGLFYGTNGVVEHQSSGFFTFAMAKYGMFSGRIIANTGRYPFRGQFDLSGHAQVDVPRNDTTLFLDLQLDLTNGTDQVSGTVTDNQFVFANLIGDRAVYNATTNAAPQAGLYTFIIPGSTNTATSPKGDGYGTVTIRSNGTIVAVGKLSDGTAISQSVSISKFGRWPFYLSLLSGDGSVFSWLTFTNLPTTSLQGDVSWIRPASSGKYYPNGFTNHTAVIGSSYTPPLSSARVLETTNNLFVIDGGNLNAAATNASTLSIGNGVYVDGNLLLALTTPANGFMSGYFLHPTLNSQKQFRGVALQLQETARGYFLGNTQSGSFLLQPND